MRKIILFCVCVTLAASAVAQTNCQTYGNQTYCNGPNGSTTTSQTLGNQTRNLQNGPGGQRVTTCRTYGTQTRCD